MLPVLSQLDALRSHRVTGLLGELRAKQAKITELGARRKANQRKLCDAALEKRRAQEAQRRLDDERAAGASWWRGDVTAERMEALEAQLAELRADSAAALAARDREISQQKAAIAELKAIAEPTKARFKKVPRTRMRMRMHVHMHMHMHMHAQGNHFNAETELAVIQVLALGVARGKVPKLFPIFARLFGVTLPAREIKVPGPIVGGKRTSVSKLVPYTPQISHCKEMAGVMYELNKLQIGQWLVEYMNSDETSCCYIADGAEAQQLERVGTCLSRRINGKLQVMALDLSTASSKTAEAQAAGYKDSIEDVVKLMEEVGLVDQRGAELLRRFLPTCSMNDRASTARLAARLVLGLGEGDDDPTCAEHALVNILEEGRKAMDGILRELMNFTDEQAEADAAKIKALRTCVGWFSSPVCALIYQARMRLIT